MLSIQQLIKALRKLQNSSCGSGSGADLVVKSLKHVAATTPATTSNVAPVVMTSLLSSNGLQYGEQLSLSLPPQGTQTQTSTTDSSQQQLQVNSLASTQHAEISLDSDTLASGTCAVSAKNRATNTKTSTNINAPNTTTACSTQLQQRSQQIQKFYQQHLHHFHTQHNQSLCAKQKQTQFAMSSLAAEPVPRKQEDILSMNGNAAAANTNGGSCSKGEPSNAAQQNSSLSATSDKPSFNTANLAQILQFMELIGNLKHTKRTGWVLRDVSDCESISGHMYRMSMMTFLLDGTEGLNQIRCMELALVHDLAESLVGDITPFCGVSKSDKRAMEFKAMEDICKLIEPRGKRIMELFEEYETGESAESKFVKDLDRLDMVMQAFEYEKRDNCLLKHQEFFDSTAGKFNHPFVKKLVDEINVQRHNLARAKGATPPPPVHVPNMEDVPVANGHGVDAANATLEAQQSKSSSSS